MEEPIEAVNKESSLQVITKTHQLESSDLEDQQNSTSEYKTKSTKTSQETGGYDYQIVSGDYQMG